jgi:hypothetical protein
MNPVQRRLWETFEGLAVGGGLGAALLVSPHVFDYAAGKRDPPPGPWPLPKELDLVIARMSAAFGVTPENPPSAAASDYNFALVAVRVVVLLDTFSSLLFLSVCRCYFEY